MAAEKSLQIDLSTDWRGLGNDNIVGNHIFVPSRLQQLDDLRMRGGQVAGFTWIIPQIIELPIAGAGGHAELEKLPVSLPNGAVAEQFPAQPVILLTHRAALTCKNGREGLALGG